MDIVSYSVAAKQKQRIEQVIANPDSTSGIVTTPSVIAVGETINIPAGRTAVLPNTTVNGTLVVDGEVFIPSGSSYTATNINVSGVGSRITGDFSNLNRPSRTMLQTSVVDGFTSVDIIPNGVSQISQLQVANSSDPTNASVSGLGVNANDSRLFAGRNGTGTYLPLVFYTNGSERMRIDTAGNVGIGSSTIYGKFQVNGNGTTSATYNTLTYSSTGGLLTAIDDAGNMLVRSAAGGLGYGTGAGGTVTQLTSKSTAVTLNKPSGQITMNNTALAAGASVTFLLYTSAMSTNSNDLVVVNVIASSVGNQGNYSVRANSGAGGAFITLKNESAGSLSEAVIIDFAIIKGAAA